MHSPPEQETGNLPFVVDSGFGAYTKDPPALATKVGEWMRNPEKVRCFTSEGEPFPMLRGKCGIPLRNQHSDNSNSTATGGVGQHRRHTLIHLKP